MYHAMIARLENVRKHPNADRLQLATVCGHQVVVDLARFNGNLGVFFPPDGKLSHDFVVHNHLYTKSAAAELNLTVDAYGFIDYTRRVRAQRFRGEKSEGLWLPMESLAPWGQPPEGTAFATLNGVRICEKHESQRTRMTGQKVRSQRRGELPGFPKHVDTEQWGYYKNDIPVGSLITITEKLHGTSHRAGMVRTPRPWWKFWQPTTQREDGSRNVILSQSAGQGYYGSDEFRTRAVPVVGRVGEILYGEIVGYVDGSTPIMPSVSIDPKELPEEYQQYGYDMAYSYGCMPGTSKFFIYRITQWTEHGDMVELSHSQVRARANELGYSVPTCFTQLVLRDDEREQLDRIVQQYTVGPSMESSLHLREGVVIRIDTPDGRTYFLKNKSFAFKVLEGIIKSNDTYVDREESA